MTIGATRSSDNDFKVLPRQHPDTLKITTQEEPDKSAKKTKAEQKNTKKNLNKL